MRVQGLDHAVERSVAEDRLLTGLGLLLGMMLPPTVFIIWAWRRGRVL